MTSRHLLLAAFFALAACAPAEQEPAVQDTAADEATLTNDAGVWFDHYNKGDAEAVTNLYTADALVLPDQAPALSGHAAIRDYLTADMAQTKAAGLSFKNGEVTGVAVTGDMAWLSGTYSVVDSAGATVTNGKYISVYTRAADGWKLVRDIWNADQAPAAPATAATGQ